jgi:hypothetical protein
LNDGIAAGRLEVSQGDGGVAVMSLSMREQQALADIEYRLAGADPKLAWLLATFTRLTSGEGMPACEQVRRRVPWMRQLGRRACRLLAAYAGLECAMALLWVLIAVGLIALAVALSGSGSRGACVRSWTVACPAPAPAHPARPVAPPAS